MPRRKLVWLAAAVLGFLVGETSMARMPATVSFLETNATVSQNAVFAPFLSSIDGGAMGDTAISLSHVALGPDEPAGPLTIFLKSSVGATYNLPQCGQSRCRLGSGRSGPSATGSNLDGVSQRDHPSGAGR